MGVSVFVVIVLLVGHRIHSFTRVPSRLRSDAGRKYCVALDAGMEIACGTRAQAAFLEV